MGFADDTSTMLLQSTTTTSSDAVLFTVTRLYPPTFISTNDGGQAVVTLNIKTSQDAAASPSSPLASSSASIDSLGNTIPAVIAGSVIGSLAFVVVLALLFVLWQRRKYHNKIGNNISDDTGPPTVVPDQILTRRLRSSFASVQTISILTTTSVASNLPRRLSQSSRNAYEAEIERRGQQVRYMDEQTQFMQSATPPPSYRSSRRSDASDPFLDTAAAITTHH